MTKVLRISHGIRCVRDQVAKLLRQADPHASLQRRSQRLVCEPLTKQYPSYSTICFLCNILSGSSCPMNAKLISVQSTDIHLRIISYNYQPCGSMCSNYQWALIVIVILLA